MTPERYLDHEGCVEARRPALKYAQTVLGPARQDQLGVVLPHEHILADFRALHDPFYPDLSERKVELSVWGRIRRHPTTCLDNLLLDDAGLAAAELAHFARASGGGTVVELSGTARLQPEALPALAERTGLHIIAGTGWPSPAYYPTDLGEQPLPALAERLARDVQEGIEGAGYRAGAIGLIGVSDLGDPQQRKVLRAAAQAARASGAPLVLEGPTGDGFAAAHRILQEAELPAGQVLLSGMDRFLADGERLKLAQLGYYLLFDSFGKEWYWRGWQSRTPRDYERLAWLKELADGGYLERLLVSQGIDRKNLISRYGGYGYAHFLENVVPWMERDEGARAKFAPKQITTLTRHNPARALAWSEEPGAVSREKGERGTIA